AAMRGRKPAFPLGMRCLYRRIFGTRAPTLIRSKRVDSRWASLLSSGKLGRILAGFAQTRPTDCKVGAHVLIIAWQVNLLAARSIEALVAPNRHELIQY